MRLGRAAPWSELEWTRVHSETNRRVLDARTTADVWTIVQRQARTVLRTYSTSFFIVTRFLPAKKRAQVEVIYAAVRYPDEIVDTFAVNTVEQLQLLEQWAGHYERALAAPSVDAAVAAGVPALLAAFVSVVKARDIPPQHYRDFLLAMRRDVHPAPFASLDDLIDNYIHGSAVVVGYFLAHVYGPNAPSDVARAQRSARELAVALQLTNFLRDVGEDQRRGRVYLPDDLLREQGIARFDASDLTQHAALGRVIRRLAAEAEGRYARAARDVDAFAPDSQTAIRACIAVYGQLNTRISQSSLGILHRERVPFLEKCRVLPTSKYWRLPLEYLIS